MWSSSSRREREKTDSHMAPRPRSARGRARGAGTRGLEEHWDADVDRPGEGQLNLIGWPGYLEKEWVTPFEKQSGCKVNVKIAETSDEMVALMRSGGGGQYDRRPPPVTRACGSSTAATSPR